MSNDFIDNSDNELIHIRNKVSCELNWGKSIRFTGAHDRPAIFIENNNDDYDDFATLLNY
jgi:hypothetical protein